MVIPASVEAAAAWLVARGYGALFWGALAEGVGLPVPIGFGLALAGLGVARGPLDVVPALLAFLGGNLVADAIAYAVGRRLRRVPAWLPRFARPGWRRCNGAVPSTLTLSGVVAIQVLSRMARVPVIYGAGVLGIPLAPFLTACLVGNLIWGTLWLLAGMQMGWEPVAH